MPRKPAAFLNVSFSRLAESAQFAPDERRLPYHRAYAEFVQYFAGLDIIASHNLIIGAHCVYGWMPTILTLNGSSDDYAAAANLLTQIKYGAAATASHLETLANLVNNSLIGTSKLLHFLRPDLYAIWDSRVCRFIYGKYMVDSRPREIERYFAYLENCRELATDPRYPALHAEICNNKIGMNVAPLRAIEWVMYSAAPAQ